MLRIFFDTNALIEAHRAGCWNTIAAKSSIETVATCRAEALTGSGRRPGYVTIQASKLDERLVTHLVDRIVLSDALLQCPVMRTMDEGEQELVAFVRTISGSDWRFCGPDNSAYRSMRALGLLDRTISLEAVCLHCGMKRVDLRNNYLEKWHSQARTKFLLDETCGGPFSG